MLARTQCGNIKIFNTGAKEHTNISFKAGWLRSNKIMEMFAAQLMKSCFRVETLLLHSPPPPPKPIPSLLAQCKPRLVQVGDGKVDMILGIKVAFSQCGRPWTLSTYYHNQRHVSVLCIFRAVLLFLCEGGDE